MAIASVIVLALLFLSYLCRQHFHNRKKAKGPFALPLLGHLHLLGKNPHKSLSDLSKTYGSVMSIKLGMVQSIVVSSPDAAKAVLSTNDLVFASRPELAAFKHLFYHSSERSVHEYGPYWKKIRKSLAMELFTVKTGEQFKKLRTEEVSRLISSIMEEGRNGEIPVEMNKKLTIANTNLLRFITVNWRTGNTEFMTPGDYFPFLKWLDGTRKMKAVHEKLDKILQHIINERRHELSSLKVEDTSLLDMLLLSNELDDKALITATFVASSDTIAVVTEWALSELIKNPTCMIKAQKEIDLVVGCHRAVTEEDLSSLSYLRAVIKETFRLHPVEPFLLPHQSTTSCMVNGFFVPANTWLFVNVWSIGRDPRWWESPEIFNPERFRGQSLLDVKGQHFELLPFGSGRRICPGMNLGLIMVEMSVARLIQAFEWKAADENLNMDEDFTTTLRRKVPLRCLAKPRQ